jgi:phosphate-selective porin
VKQRLLLGAALAGILLSSPTRAAVPTDDDQQDLQREIAELKSRVADLEARAKRQADAQANVTKADVMSDAQRQSSITGGNFSMNYTGGKLLLQSEDKNFLLHPWFQLQFRNVTNFRDDSKDDGDNSTENGFEVRRMKFGADGNIFTPNFTYLFVWATDRHNGNPVLEEAWAKYKFGSTPWSLKAGQFKDPLDHEQLISSKYLMASERSLVADVFANGDAFVQGVTVGYDPNRSFRAEAGFTDGLRSANTNFQDYPDVTAGNSPPADDHFTAIGNSDDLLVVGAGADYTEAGDTGSLVHVVDAHYATKDHWSFYAAYLGRYTKNNMGGATPADTYDWTLRGQVAYAFDRHWEPFARYDFISFDDAGLAAGSEDQVHEITVGLNYYFHGHAAKLTVDGMYLPNGSPVGDDGSDVLASGDGEFVAQIQFQLLL